MTGSGGIALTIPSGTTWNCRSGSFGTFGSITNNGILNFTGLYNHNFGADLTNHGTINWTLGNLDNDDSDNTLINYGTFNYNGIGGVSCYFAILNKSGGIISKTASAVQTINKPFVNEPGGTAIFSAGSMFFNTGSSIVNGGSFSAPGIQVSLGDNVNITLGAGSVFSGGTLSFNSGTQNIDAPGGFAPDFTTVILNGTITGAGSTSLTIPTGKTLSWGNGTIGAFSSFTNNGTINATGFFSHNTSADLTNYGVISWTVGHLDLNGSNTLTNYGTFNFNGPNLSFCNFSIINKSGGIIRRTAGAGGQ